ncbi:MAG TPA: ubiquinol oxidase subunit II [Candidatus Saccharimonadales bacterium]|nr:ubiquinol oxidase subunit II [Candidatus Saccharimonadales bacterium]
MQKLYRNCLIVLLVLVAIVVGWYTAGRNLPVLQPSGVIAAQEATLITVIFVLMLIVALPVFGLTIFIVWRYRESNQNAKYMPDYDSNRLAELTWWGIPIILIAAIGTLTWVSSHQLDPYKSLAAGMAPMKIQVVSLDWKWLFIYPENDIASVNYAVIPVDRPVEFDITSDSVMNSFWVPALGSQMYTMPGMKTKLNLLATETGNYYGSSANISGSGFASMHFTVAAKTPADMDAWISDVSGHTDRPLDIAAYADLSKPGIAKSKTVYGSVVPHLYDKIVNQYMMPNMTIQPTVESPKKANSTEPHHGATEMPAGHADMVMPMGDMQ